MLKYILCFFNILLSESDCAEQQTAVIGKHDMNLKTSKQYMYDDGDILKYTCSKPGEVITLQIYHLHGINSNHFTDLYRTKTEYEMTKLSDKDTISLELVLMNFDNVTQISCEIKNSDKKVWLTFSSRNPGLPKKGLNEKNSSSLTVYDDGLIKYCKGTMYTRWLRIKGGEIDDNYSPKNYFGEFNDTMYPLFLEKDDEGLAFVCITYTYQSSVYRRETSKLIVVQPKSVKVTLNWRSRNEKKVHEWQYTHYKYYYAEGEAIDFICYSNSSKKVIHRKGEYEMFNIDGNSTDVYTLSLTLTRYDDDTSIVCSERFENAAGQRYDIIITFIWDNVKRKDAVIYKPDLVTSISEDNNYKAGDKLYCSGDMLNRWHRIIDNSIDVGYRLTSLIIATESSGDKLLLKLRESDNKKTFICTTYQKLKIQNSTDFLRYVSAPVFTKIYGLNSSDFEPSVELNISNAPSKSATIMYVLYASIPILVIVVTYITFKITAKYRRRPHEVETYASAGRVQYADLQMTSSPNRMHVVCDETPYAQIIGVMVPED